MYCQRNFTSAETKRTEQALNHRYPVFFYKALIFEKESANDSVRPAHARVFDSRNTSTCVWLCVRVCEAAYVFDVRSYKIVCVCVLTRLRLFRILAYRCVLVCEYLCMSGFLSLCMCVRYVRLFCACTWTSECSRLENMVSFRETLRFSFSVHNQLLDFIKILSDWRFSLI